MAKTKRAAAGRVQVRGAPHRLSALITLPKQAGRSSGRALLVGVEAGPVIIRPLHGETLGLLNLRLPESTPPGTYEGVAEIGNARIPLVVEVGARARLRAAPQSLETEGAPGARLAAEITLANVGNVAVEVPGRGRLPLFEWEGVEDALAAALGEPQREGERRIDRFMAELAESFGSFLELEIGDGAGSLPPGKTRPIRLDISLPENLRPGHSYRGAWKLENLRYSISIRTAQASAPARKRPSTRRAPR